MESAYCTGPSSNHLTDSKFEIRGLAKEWHPKRRSSRNAQGLAVKDARKWPVIVIDEMNFSLATTDGPIGSFLYTLPKIASAQKIIVYVCTNNRKTAYQLWQLNGGNFIQPHLICLKDAPSFFPTGWKE